MIKYDHLRILKHENTQYVVNTETKRGYLFSPLIEKLISQRIIQVAEPDEIKIRLTEAGNDGAYLEKRKATLKELSLSPLD